MDEKRDLIQVFDHIEPGQCPECKSNMILRVFESSILRLNKYGEPIQDLRTENIAIAICPKCGCTKDMTFNIKTMSYVPTTSSLMAELELNQKNIVEHVENKVGNPFVQAVMKGIQNK